MTTLFVSGTGTDVGKTIATAAIAALARDAGQRVAVVKPVQTGLVDGEPGDLADVERLSGVSDLHEFVRYPDPLAPEAAARRVGQLGPSVADLADQIAPLAEDRDLVIVEGAGGLLVRLNRAGETFADLATALTAPVLVVVRPDLGTLNHTALTLEALERREIECAGVVLGTWPAEPDLACQENVRDLSALARGRLLGRLPSGAARLAPADFLALARAGLAPALGGLFHPA